MEEFCAALHREEKLGLAQKGKDGKGESSLPKLLLPKYYGYEMVPPLSSLNKNCMNALKLR